MNRKPAYRLLSFVFVLGILNQVAAQNRYSVATGNWNSTATWSATSGGAAGASVPTASDNVIIERGYTVTLNTNGQGASLTLNAKVGGTASVSQLTIGAFTLNITGDVTLNGSGSSATRASKIVCNNNAAILTIGGNLQLGSGAGIANSAVMDMSTWANVTSTLNIAGSMTRNTTDGQFIPGTGSTVNYNGTAAQTINLSQFNYANLVTNNTDVASGATLSAALTATNTTGNVTVNSGLFRTNSLGMTMANAKNLFIALGASLDAGTTQIAPGTSATVTVNGTFQTANTNGFSGTTGTAIISSNSPTIVLGASSTITYYNGAATQIVTARTDYANVTLSGVSKTIGTSNGQTVTISKTLTINTGATYDGSVRNPILNVGGDFSNSGNFTQGTATVTFNGSASSQTILGSTATTFSNNVTINNTSGTPAINITTSPTINGLLTFTNGKIVTGANKVILGTSATVSGAGAGKYINGNLEINIPNAAAPSRTFTIGDASNYTPVLIAFSGTTSGSGSLIAYCTAGDDPDINNAGINSSLSVNRTWNITNSGTGGFTSCSGTFTFVAGDIDGGANTNNFVVRKNDGTWATTTTGTRTATSTQATGMTTFGTYQIGEARTITVATNPSNSAVCAGSNHTFTSTSSSIPAPAVKWQRGNPGYTDISAALDAPNTTYSDFTTTTLTLSGSETAINGYLYRAVFSNINGTATSSAAALTVNASPSITSQPSDQSVCTSTNADFSVTTSAGSPAYQWQMSPDGAAWANTSNGTPSGVTYANSTTSTLTVNGSFAVSLYYYRCVVTASGCFRNSNSATLTINDVPAAAGAITGSSSACQNQSGVAYSAGALSGAASYTWAYSGTGAAFSSNPSAAPNITIDFSAGATSGNLTVRGINTCGSGTASPAYSITVSSSVPAASGSITGNTSACMNQTYPYSVGVISGATSYTWNYTGTGLTFSSPAASMNGSFNATATSGILTVRGTNGCGNGAASPNLSITVSNCSPHGSCNGCHIFHGDPVGGPVTASPGNSNLCISCHNPSGIASTKPFDNNDKATPGVSGNSHSWDRNAVNAAYETVNPNDPQTAQKDSMRLRLPGGKIICSTCHDQHNPNTDVPFLRVSNTGNAMCKDCHSPRDVGRYSDNPALNKGSHPVGLVYPNPDTRFNNPPGGSVALVSGKIECTSCHKQHYAPTNDGYILRQTNNAALCTSCHTYSSHQGQDCKVCHQTHNTNKANIYMIKDVITTPPSDGSQNRAVVFTSETGANSFADGDATYNGVCEVCHTATPGGKHRNSAGGDHSHQAGQKCVNCHSHKNGFPGCTGCHTMGGAHATHTQKYSFACSTCHYQRGAGTAYHENAVNDVNFNPNGLATRNGQDATPTPNYNTGTKVCTNVYCHSNGITADRGGSWGSLPFGTVAYATTPSWSTGTITGCNQTSACHDAMASAPPPPSPYTYSVPGPLSGSNYQPNSGAHRTSAHTSNSQGWCPGTPGTTTWTVVNCFWCHNTNGTACNAVNYLGTYGTSYHVDGQTYFNPLKWPAGTMAPWNQYASDGTGAHCGNGRTCW